MNHPFPATPRLRTSAFAPRSFARLAITAAATVSYIIVASAGCGGTSATDASSNTQGASGAAAGGAGGGSGGAQPSGGDGGAGPPGAGGGGTSAGGTSAGGMGAAGTTAGGMGAAGTMGVPLLPLMSIAKMLEPPIDSGSICLRCTIPVSAAMPSQWPPSMASLIARIHCWPAGTAMPFG